MASIQGIYVALFGRPADPAGLAFFNGSTGNGADLTAIGDLASTAEYQSRFTGMTNEQIVNAIYQSLFERDGETAGIDYWVAKLESGEITVNTIAIAILDGAQGDDLTTVNAKIAAADIFTAHLNLDIEVQAYNGDFAEQVGRDFLATVTKDDAGTEAEADAAILRLLAGEGQEPGNGNGGGGGDTTAPDAPTAAYDPKTNTLSGKAEPGSTIHVFIDGKEVISVTVDTNGDWSLDAPPANKGETVSLTATDAADNESDATTIEGGYDNINDTPIITSKEQTGSVKEDVAEQLTASGQVTASDADANATLTYTVDKTSGTYGSIALDAATGAWTYTLANSSDAVQKLADGETKTETFTVTVTDDKNATTTQAVTVTVTGTNDTATITGNVTGAVAEDGTLSTGGTVSVSDKDEGQNHFETPASLAGTYGTFAFNAATGVWAYDLNNTATNVQGLAKDQTVTDTLTVKSADGSDTEVITVTVTGKNDAPTATAVTLGSILEDATSFTITAATLLAGTSDKDIADTRTITALSVASGGGTLTPNSGGTSWTYKPAANYNGTVSFNYSVSDNHSAATSSTASLTVTAVNDAPTLAFTAQAGANTSDGGLSYTRPIIENNSQIHLGTVSATDIEQGNLPVSSVSMSGDTSFFEIGTDGKLYLKAGIDYEDAAVGSDHQVSVTLTATDSAGANSNQKTYTVTVGNLTGSNDPITVSNGGTASGTGDADTFNVGSDVRSATINNFNSANDTINLPGSISDYGETSGTYQYWDRGWQTGIYSEQDLRAAATSFFTNGDHDVFVVYNALNSGNAYVYFDTNGNGTYSEGNDTFLIITGIDSDGKIGSNDFT